MNALDPPQVRKRRLADSGSPAVALPANEIDIVNGATILYSSESSAGLIDQLFDGRSGRGATRWVSARPDTTEEIVIEFDQPQRVRRLIFDAEERFLERTQQVTLEYSTDGGHTYRTALVQEYTFSPNGSTYQREDLGFALSGVTHIKLFVMPNKSGAGTASLTSLRIFG